jgi:hypothetical protein
VGLSSWPSSFYRGVLQQCFYLLDPRSNRQVNVFLPNVNSQAAHDATVDLQRGTHLLIPLQTFALENISTAQVHSVEGSYLEFYRSGPAIDHVQYYRRRGMKYEHTKRKREFFLIMIALLLYS